MMNAREAGVVAACGVFAFLYLRSLPFAYHLRFLGHCLWAKYIAKPPASLFEETVLDFRCWPDDVDFNWHMGNSSYNKICDFCRYAHFARLGFSSNVSGANGGVYMRFKRALQPMQVYSVATRVVCFDDKWVFLEHRFLGEDGRVKAAGLVKIVLLDGSGRARRPAEAFGDLGFGGDVAMATPSPADHSGGGGGDSPSKTAQLVHEFEKKAAELTAQIKSSGSGSLASGARPGPSGLMVGVDCIDSALYLLRADAGFGKDDSARLA